MSISIKSEKRCYNCKSLLFKGVIHRGIVEIKCKCGKINTFSHTVSFQERLKLNLKELAA